MKLPWWTAPWHSYRKMRRRWSVAAAALTIATERALQLRDERDEALAELHEIRRRRSRAIAQGNRTRSLRRHGGLVLVREPIPACGNRPAGDTDSPA
jgi:hypothetical protein